MHTAPSMSSIHISKILRIIELCDPNENKISSLDPSLKAKSLKLTDSLSHYGLGFENKVILNL